MADPLREVREVRYRHSPLGVTAIPLRYRHADRSVHNQRDHHVMVANSDMDAKASSTVEAMKQQ